MQSLLFYQCCVVPIFVNHTYSVLYRQLNLKHRSNRRLFSLKIKFFCKQPARNNFVDLIKVIIKDAWCKRHYECVMLIIGAPETERMSINEVKQIKIRACKYRFISKKLNKQISNIFIDKKKYFCI